ncbi:MAG: DNA adenine methylase [Colwellia sp.]|nr:DNA adenine methylase [Colwellia sp.]
MKYMGSKARLKKQLLPIILKDRKEGQHYVEPFVGGANMIDGVSNPRLAGEFNKYIAEMWIALESGWVPPNDITKTAYVKCRDQVNKGVEYGYSDKALGWVGINCSYSGKWYGGYAGVVDTKGGVRDYQKEAHKNVMKQIPSLKGVTFKHSSYSDLTIPQKSIIYCDPPYAGTTGYKDAFDNEAFWSWCREMVGLGHKVFVSEYIAPDDFVCIWSKDVKSSLSANGKAGGNKVSSESLFVHESQV